MADLDTLRPEVRDALDDLSYFLTGTHNHDDFYTIRTELLRLAKENRILEVKNAGTLANNLCPDHRDKQVGRPCLACLIEKAEAELAALKARIADSPIASLVYGQGDLLAVISAENPDDWAGKRVRLVEVE